MGFWSNGVLGYWILTITPPLQYSSLDSPDERLSATKPMRRFQQHAGGNSCHQRLKIMH
jgi:hypothetical protein